MADLILEPRFNGPAGSGNGGYTAGRLAAHLALSGDQQAQVTLRLPPPLGTPLRVRDAAGGGIQVYAEDRLIAEATPVEPDPDPPVPPARHPEAVDAAAAYPGFVAHPFPTCYVCGPDRPPGDGLRIFPGPLPDRRTAAPWLVPEDCAAATVWAALDCPGGWAIIAPGRPYVLGRMTARVYALPPAGSSCVVTGQVAAIEGRKGQVRTALYHPAGADGAGQPRLLARACSTWVAI